MLTFTFVAVRRIPIEFFNRIRGPMKMLDPLIPAGKGRTFRKDARGLLVEQDGLAGEVALTLGGGDEPRLVAFWHERPPSPSIPP